MSHARNFLVIGLLAAATSASALKAQDQDVMVDASTIISLEMKLRAFASGLPMGEQRAFAGLLRGAAGAPSDNPASVNVVADYTSSSRAGARLNLSRGIIVQGGKVGPDAAQSIGPKQDDPRAPAAGKILAIGPKQDDPRSPGIVRDKLRSFSSSLSLGEAATLDWFMQRAASGPTIGGIPPEEGPALSRALGINPLAIGPKQDDPSPPPQAFKATLRVHTKTRS